MLQIKLFGPGQATYFGRPLAAFPSQQPYQLLCYLLIQARYPVLRDQIAAVFWGEISTSSALKNLRNALWKLRQFFAQTGADLDTYLLVSDSSVMIRRTSPYWLDVEVFEAAVQSCQTIPGQDLHADQAALLAEAVALYSGDLMEGNYCDWCLYERERLSMLYLSALARLASFYEFCGDWAQGLQYGERILARDNTRERIHLQMMRLYWMAGDRDAALAQYKRCCEILRDELGVAPMRETAQVFQQMAHGQYMPSLATRLVNPGLETGVQHKLLEIREGGLQDLAEKTLQRVHYLQTLLEDTRTELSYIESLINRELLNSGPAK
jgi:DNA-binding SARP family transcriptional activator